MTNAELKTKFLKFNKVAREVRAKRLGYQSAAAFIAFLNGGGIVEPVAVVSAPKKVKNVKTVLSVPTIHIVDIADKSGSMQGGRDEATVEGINSGIIELQRNPNGIHYTHTYCEFETRVKIHHIACHPDYVSRITTGTRGKTALWDAIGRTVDALQPYVKESDKVLVNIYTDGQENVSKEFTSPTIRETIKYLSTKGWTFTFIGTKRDVDFVVKAVNIHISNTRSYDGTAAGMQASMSTNSISRANYEKKVLNNEDVSEGYFSKDIID